MSSNPPNTAQGNEEDNLESVMTKAMKYMIMLASVAGFTIIGIWIGTHVSVFDFNFLMTSAGQMYVYYNSTHNSYYLNTANADAGYAVEIATLDIGAFGILGLVTGLFVGSRLAEHIANRRRANSS